MKLLTEDESRSTAITKGISMKIGLRGHRNWRVVERNISVVVQIAYNQNLLLMNEIASYTLMEPPCVSDFISALFAYVAR